MILCVVVAADVGVVGDDVVAAAVAVIINYLKPQRLQLQTQ